MDEEEEKKISKHEFYFEIALYEPVTKAEIQGNIYSGTVNAYNSLDGFDTTYEISASTVNDYHGWESFRRVALSCKRDGPTILRFFIVDLEGGRIMKVGQFPSLADIQFAEIGKRYDKLLSEEDLRNYKKAIGLRAHGVGAGSFVYLRRIFENLIIETYKANKSALGLDDVIFLRKRMEEKVDALKTVLPSQLVQMKSVYGILSKGVHELTEEECLEYFSPIRLSIELILDQKIEIKQKSEKDAQVKKELDKINQTIKSKT
ncbi:hypothetical protein HYV70_05300 [Candidatus Uhrbacteria bacterium]|nr:hypothetical protein [Candidatus Uhrbacteria bacterium]